MLSRNQLKYFSSLSQKKFRKIHGRFLAEGEKIVREILSDRDTFLKPVTLIAEPAFISAAGNPGSGIGVITAGTGELKKISSFASGTTAILELEIPDYSFHPEEITGKPSLFFEDIRDPGNLGTIIRTADWFGIRDIFCSRESVDTYNPKVVQSSMGSLARVKVHYVDAHSLIDSLKSIQPGYAICGTVLNGDNIFRSDIPLMGMIMFGNESRGLPSSVISRCDRLVTIPSNGNPWAESLNVSIATAIVCSEWCRRSLTQNENKA